MESFGINSFSEKDILAWFERNRLYEAIHCFHSGCLQIETTRDQVENNCLDIMLCTRSPEKWVGLCFACLFLKQRVWFTSPVWRQMEWQQVSATVRPRLVMGDDEFCSKFDSDIELPEPVSNQPGLMIPTGGSSGVIKFAWHTPDTLTAAVNGMSRFFFNRGVKRGDFSYRCNLPLWHVSGWMQVFRSFLSDSTWSSSPIDIQSIPDRSESSRHWLSVVPTQLARMIQSGHTVILRDVDYVVIGGGACPENWLKMALQNGIHPWVTYGMTETAGMIAGKQIVNESDILSGAVVFPHVNISIEPVEAALEEGFGEINVCSQSMCLGYNGKRFRSDALSYLLQTGDIGCFDSERQLYVKGRLDSLLNTGGEKVFPLEVQSVIRSFPSISDCWVTGIEDSEWGTKLVCFYSTTDSCAVDVEELKGYIATRLGAYKIPKICRHVNQIPYDQKGKINSSELINLLEGSVEKS